MSKILAILTALVALAPATAFAQMTATVVQLNNSTRQASDFDLVTTPLNGTDCMSASMDIRLRMIDSSASLIDVWRGQNCNQTSQRAGMATNECVHLTLSGQDLTINSRTEIDLTEVAFAELLDSCSLGDGDYGIWFLAASTAMSNEEVSSYASIDIRLDTTAPMAPINIAGGRGGTQINITWEGGNGTGGEASDHKEYVVYGDPGSVVMGEDCSGSTTTLVPGSPVPSGMTELSRGTGRSTTIDPRPLGAEENTSAYVVVVEVDQAGNESVASELACITRIATSGFCDAAGENCKSCSVTNAGIPRGPAAPALAIMALALLGLSRRKSRP
jgi:hypothetical protein